jgi:hypothetical protein
LLLQPTHSLAPTLSSSPAELPAFQGVLRASLRRSLWSSAFFSSGQYLWILAGSLRQRPGYGRHGRCVVSAFPDGRFRPTPADARRLPRRHGHRLHWFPVLPPRTAVALLRCPSGCRPGRRLVTSQSHAGAPAPLSLSNLSRQRWRVVDGVAKDKISKLLGLSTLQGSKHNTARDRPWYAQGSCLCDGIPFSFANIVQTLVC